MHAGRIDRATRHLAAPPDWDKATDGPCGTLSVRDERTHAGQGMTSAWFPTPPELERILMGAPIYLTVIGTVHPPVWMSVGPAPAER